MMLTDEGEQSFYPARIRAGRELETDKTMKDVVNELLNDVAYCRPSRAASTNGWPFTGPRDRDPGDSDRRQAREAGVTDLRLVGGVIEMDGVTVGTLAARQADGGVSESAETIADLER